MPYNTRRLPDDVKSDEEYFDETSRGYGETLGRWLDREVPPNAYGVAPLAYEGGAQPAPYPVMQGDPQGPIYQPPTQVPYADPQGPVFQLPSEQRQQPVNPMAGWADPPERGGLGLSAQPSPSQDLPYYRGIGGNLTAKLGLTTPVSPLDEYMARQMYPGVELTRGQKMRLGAIGISPDFIAKRQQLSQQLAQQAEKQQEFNWQEMLRIDKEFANDPDRWQMGMESLAKGRKFKPAQDMLAVGDKKMLGQLESSIPFIERYFPDFAKKYRTNPGGVGRAEVADVLKKVGELRKRRAEADGDAQEEAALNKAFEANDLQPGDAERLIELRNKREKAQLELEKLRLGNKKLGKEINEPAGRPKQNDTLDAVSYGVFQNPDGYWNLKGPVTPAHIKRAQQAGYDIEGLEVGMDQSVAADRLGQQRLGAAAGYGALAKGDMSQDVELGVNRSKYRKLMPDGTVVMPPNSKMTQRQAAKQGFIDTSHAMKYIDDANDLKTIEQRVEHVHSLAKEIVKADPGFGNRIGQLTKLTANALSNAGAPTNIMSTDGKRKLTVGEVVNLYNAETQQMLEAIARSANQIKGAGTEGDVGRQLRGFSSGGDTAQTMEMKFKNFRNVFKLSRRNLYATVFGDDEADKFYRANKLSDMSSDDIRKALVE